MAYSKTRVNPQYSSQAAYDADLQNPALAYLHGRAVAYYHGTRIADSTSAKRLAQNLIRKNLDGFILVTMFGMPARFIETRQLKNLAEQK